MNAIIIQIKNRVIAVVPAALDISIVINRIILLAYSNLTLALTILLLEKGASHMKKLSSSVIALLMFAVVAIAGLAYEFLCI
jgi:hypothetical protein